MKKQMVKIGLSLSLLVPAVGFSEYGDYSSQLSDLAKDTSRVESALKPATTAADSSSLGSIQEKLEAEAKKAEEKFTLNKEELEARGKVRNWTKKNSALDSLLALPDTLMQKALKARQADIEQAQKFTGRLGSSGNFLNPQDFALTGLSNACRKDVDFSQFMQSAQSLSSEPFKYMQAEASKLLEEKNENNKKAIQAKIGDILKHFKALANKEDEEAKVDASLPGENNIEARLARLKQVAKTGKEENTEKKNALVDVFGKFIKDLGTLKDNDSRVQQIGDEFAKSFENSQKAMLTAAQPNIDQLFSNCQKEIRNLKQEIENFKGHLVNYLIQRGQRADLAEQVAEADTEAQRSRVANMQCTDITQEVQATLAGVGTGTDINAKLNRIRSEKNPTKLLNEAVSLMSDAQNIQLAVGEKLRPLKQDCDDASKSREVLKARFDQMGGSSQGAGVAAQGLSSRGTSRSSVNSTHGRSN